MNTAPQLQIFAPRGVPHVQPGDDIGAICFAACEDNGIGLKSADVIVLAQKIISKAENRYVELADVAPTPRALALASETGKDPRLVEAILRESAKVLRVKPGTMIVEHKNGLTMAHAGIDQSNIEHENADDRVLLLPEDSDKSADQIRQRLFDLSGAEVAVIIADSFGRPWRRGVTGVAIGAAGFPSLVDERGTTDLYGRTMAATEVALADQVASAASLLMGQGAEALPVAVLRGLSWTAKPNPSTSLIRSPEENLFL